MGLVGPVRARAVLDRAANGIEPLLRQRMSATIPPLLGSLPIRGSALGKALRPVANALRTGGHAPGSVDGSLASGRLTPLPRHFSTSEPDTPRRQEAQIVRS